MLWQYEHSGRRKCRREIGKAGMRLFNYNAYEYYVPDTRSTPYNQKSFKFQEPTTCFLNEA